MSGIPYQSKLLPCKEFIRAARKRGYSYKKIAEMIKEKFNIECSYNTVFSFVKTRSRQKQCYTMLEDDNRQEESGQSMGSFPVNVDDFEEEQMEHKPLFKDEGEKVDKGKKVLWDKVLERAHKDHSKDLLTKIDKKQEA